MPEIELTLSSDISKLINDLKSIQATVDAFQKDAKAGFENMTTSGDKAFKDLKTGIESAMNGEIIREFTKETNKATDAVDGLTEAERKRAKILQEEISDLAELKQRQKAAFTPEEIQKYDKAIKDTELRIKSLNGGMKAFRDVTIMSLGEMKNELRQLRNTPIEIVSKEKAVEIKQRMTLLTEEISDMSKELRSTGDNTEMWIGGLQGITAAAQGVVGVLSTMGYNTEKLEKVMINLIGVSQAMSTVYDLHERGILKKMAAQIKSIFIIKAETVATELNTTATATAEKTTKGFFKTLKLNPLGLVLTAIVALGAGLYALSNYLKGAKSTTDELYDSQKQVFDQMAEAAGNMERLSVSVKNTAIGTQEHTDAVNAYNVAAKEQNLLMIDSNDNLTNQNTLMRINTELMLSRAKIQAATNEQITLYSELF